MNGECGTTDDRINDSKGCGEQDGYTNMRTNAYAAMFLSKLADPKNWCPGTVHSAGMNSRLGHAKQVGTDLSVRRDYRTRCA